MQEERKKMENKVRKTEVEDNERELAETRNVVGGGDKTFAFCG